MAENQRQQGPRYARYVAPQLTHVMSNSGVHIPRITAIAVARLPYIPPV